jgi:hypothetical protein
MTGRTMPTQPQPVIAKVSPLLANGGYVSAGRKQG